MKDKRKTTYFILTLVITSFAIFLSIKSTGDMKDRFVIAVTEAHESLITDKAKIAALINKPVDILVFSDELEFIRSIRTGEVDAFVVSPFYFISEFSNLENAKAVYGIPADYYLVSQKGLDNTVNKVAVFETFMPQILQTEVPLAHVDIYGTQKRLVSLEEAYVSHVIMHASFFDDEKHLINDRMSDHGYTQDLLILTSEWIEYDLEHEHALLSALKDAIIAPLEIPNETEMLQAMSYLFRLESISTRYYYADLVHGIE